MISDDEIILEIQGLYTNFYTYQGVVKALDGLDLSLKRGETFGLVGETGCGKSVTAHCILRLIPSPPGKIEKGHIYFSMPIEARKKRTELEKKLGEMAAKGVSKEDPTYVEAKKELKKLILQWDLQSKSEDYMQKIRGNHISMIFQEPMSALNPVFTCGDQIAEIMLVHQKRELAGTILKKIDEQIAQNEDYKKVEAHPGEGLKPGEIQYASYTTVVPEGSTKSPQCGGSFESKPIRRMDVRMLRYYHKYYERMRRDPSDPFLWITSKIPLVRRYQRLLKEEADERVIEMLKLVRIPDPDNIFNAYPFELSGGMQQRIMIAMALACRPQLLIADEPTTALDVTTQAQILKLMRDVQRGTGTSILLITHNLGVVAETCQRVGVMYAGVMAEIGPVTPIFKGPFHPYTQGLMKSIPDPSSLNERLETIEGSVPNLVKPPGGCRFHPRCPYCMEICKSTKPPMVEVGPEHTVACHLHTREN